MSKARRQQVWERAGLQCEYCQMPHDLDVQPFQLDHIRAQKHGGPTTVGNLALSCLPCNAAKGPNVAGYDPDTDSLVPLFDPRRDAWGDHFQWEGPQLLGKTSTGRATIEVLKINTPERVEQRRLLTAAYLFPRRSS